MAELAPEETFTKYTALLDFEFLSNTPDHPCRLPVYLGKLWRYR